MAVLRSAIDLDSDEARQNDAHNRALAAALREQLRHVQMGGGLDASARHGGPGKLLALERIAGLRDSHTPALELRARAALNLYDGEAPSAGIVTAIGTVSGREAVIVANDATVKGGTYYPLTV